jgi:hypothetical protein
MKFISLVDSISKNVITVDVSALLLKVEIDDLIAKELRLKPYCAEILYGLFSKHPAPLSYEEVSNILKAHKIIVSENTKMHRKLSEIRHALIAFNPTLGDLILNTRGIGYSLPLRLKNLHLLERNHSIAFKNLKITTNIAIIKTLIQDVIDLVSKNKVIRHPQGYVIDRNPIRATLVDKISIFNDCSTIIISELCTHEADFTGLRLQYFFAKLKTYIGIARISEYPISEAQWLDWFEQEVWMLFDNLQKLIKIAENNS